MNSAVDKMVEEDNQNPGMYEFRADVDTQDSEQGNFKKRLCNLNYKQITRAPWEGTMKVEKRNMWKEIRGPSTATRAHEVGDRGSDGTGSIQRQEEIRTNSVFHYLKDWLGHT